MIKEIAMYHCVQLVLNDSFCILLSKAADFFPMCIHGALAYLQLLCRLKSTYKVRKENSK